MEKHALGKKWAKLKKNPPRLAQKGIVETLINGETCTREEMGQTQEKFSKAGPKGYRGNIDKWEKSFIIFVCNVHT
nr:hypothetical protein [Tanacetum cinerariifolium]